MFVLNIFLYVFQHFPIRLVTMNIKNYITVATSVLECFYCSGVIYGWSAFDYILTEEGYFTQSCSNDTSLNNTNLKTAKIVCASQRYYMGLVFTVAVVISSVLSPIGGFVMDHFGIWVLRSISSIMYIASCLAIALSTPQSSWIILFAMTGLATSEHYIYPTNLQTANLFPKYRATVNALLTAAFTTSVIAFTIVKLAYQSGFAIKHIFLFMAFLGLIMLLRTYFFLPKHVIPYDIPKDYTYGVQECFPKSKNHGESLQLLQPPKATENDISRSLKSCIFDSMYILGTFTLIIQWVGMDVYIEALYSFLTYIVGSENYLVKFDINIFGYLHITAFVFAPINGLLFDYLLKYYEAKPSMTSLQARKRSLSILCLISSCLSIAFSIFALILNAQLQYATFILLVMATVFSAANFTLLLVQTFPMSLLGSLFSITLAVYAIGVALQYGLYYIGIHIFNGNFFVMNVVSLVLCIATLLHPFNLYRKSLSKN